MTPEEIKQELAKHPAGLCATKVQNGYSFWLGLKGVNNRIVRVKSLPGSAVTSLKLAVTSRLPDLAMERQAEFPFSGKATDLYAYVDREIALYRTRIAPQA